MPVVDMLGKRIGRLTVIARDSVTPKSKQVQWRCRYEQLANVLAMYALARAA